MSKVALVCPNCCSPLRVPEESLGKKGRCPSCKTVFVLQKSLTRHGDGFSADDNDVLNWIGGSVNASDNSGVWDPIPPKPAEELASLSDSISDLPGLGATKRKKPRVRLDHVDNMGAFFLFSPRLLKDGAFRSSLPQRCLLCGSPDELSVYPLVWSCKFKAEKKKKNNDVKQTPFVIKLSRLKHKSPQDLLKVLKPVENIPEPYCLPFPYYVCPSCSPVGALMTHVHQKKGQNSAGQSVIREVCELGISSLRQAERFAQIVCDPDSNAVEKIRSARQKGSPDSWRALPLAVRNRIKLWFAQEDTEKFVAYVSDDDFAKAEAGTAGLVVTNKRVIFRKSVSFIEMSRSEPIEIDQETKDNRILLILRSPGQKPAKLAVNPTTAKDVRNLLKSQNQHHGRTVINT